MGWTSVLEDKVDRYYEARRNYEEFKSTLKSPQAKIMSREDFMKDLSDYFPPLDRLFEEIKDLLDMLTSPDAKELIAIEDQQIEMIELKRNVEQLRSDNGSMRDGNLAVEAELNHIKDSRKSAEQLKKENRSLREKCDLVRKELDDTKRILGERKLDVQRLEGHNNMLQGKLKEVTARNDRLENQNESLTAFVRDRCRCQGKEALMRDLSAT